MILTIGYAALALVLILLCADATSLYLAQKRLDALADGAAVAAAEGIAPTTGTGPVVVRLDDDEVHRQAALFVRDNGDDEILVAAVVPDGSSARVTVAETWHPPVITLFVPRGVDLRATATSRTALD
ncbi:MAG TPA: hypothetical protein VJR25_11435 [Microbacterium sp.]|uniref:hypothetical protein n=1 Tax=Microbacterium sp. TaxID=51671 RepID=UPI002B46E08B|nr:hypothetical protein [Microbacterium sp.]HKT57373.1 hypothetical protein [Microbacterium sp.]